MNNGIIIKDKNHNPRKGTETFSYDILCSSVKEKAIRTIIPARGRKQLHFILWFSVAT